MKAPEPTSEEIEQTLTRIGAREDKHEVADNRKVAVEIWDEFAGFTNEQGRQITIPKPTLGMIQLYTARRDYFDDEAHGLGRLLWALDHQYQGGGDTLRRLRRGGDISEDEASDYLDKMPAEDVTDYFVAFWGVMEYGREQGKKKLMTYWMHKLQESAPPEASPNSPKSPDTD